jgi:hypothetical protein
MGIISAKTIAMTGSDVAAVLQPPEYTATVSPLRYIHICHIIRSQSSQLIYLDKYSGERDFWGPQRSNKGVVT